MKKYLFLAFIVLTGTLLAGEPSWKIYVPSKNTKTKTTRELQLELGLGAAIPVLQYANKDGFFGNDTVNVHGYADVGFHFHGAASVQIGGRFGLRLLVGGNVNRFDKNAYNKLLSGPSTMSSGVSEAGSHYVGQYLLGPTTTFVFGAGRFTVDLFAQIGVVTSAYPMVTITFPSGPPGFKETIKYKNAANFGYSGGFTAAWLVATRLRFGLNIVYTGSNIVYHKYTSTVEGAPVYYGPGIQNGTHTYAIDRKMSLGIITAGLGIVLLLSR